MGNFIVFPREMTPRWGSWTLEFEVKPTAARKQVLFSHHGHYTGSVTIYLENVELSSEYGDRFLTTMTFRVSGKASEPLPGPGLYLGASVFGGLGNGTEFFEGRLRGLRMVHRAE